MTTEDDLDPLELSALLCSRVCHDIISPVAALGNGLEVFDTDDETMREFALDLIRKASDQASSKLQFARRAFGSAGSIGAEIELGDAERVVRGILDQDKMQLSWSAPSQAMPKDKVKLLLNLITIATTTIPRGGSIAVDVSGSVETPTFRIKCTGPKARIPPVVSAYFGGGRPKPADPHEAQPYFTSLVGESCNMRTAIAIEGDEVTITSISG